MLVVVVAAALLATHAAWPVRAQEPVLEIDSNRDTTSMLLVGTWVSATYSGALYNNHKYSSATLDPNVASYAVFRPTFPNSGKWRVELWYAQHANRATNVPVTVRHKHGSETFSVNMQTNGAKWNVLNTFEFDAGFGGNLTLETLGTNGFVSCDAARFTYLNTPSATPSVSPSPSPSPMAPCTFEDTDLDEGEVGGTVVCPVPSWLDGSADTPEFLVVFVTDSPVAPADLSTATAMVRFDAASSAHELIVPANTPAAAYVLVYYAHDSVLGFQRSGTPTTDRYAFPSPDPPIAASFTDVDGAGLSVQGTLSLTPPASTSTVESYAVYLADSPSADHAAKVLVLTIPVGGTSGAVGPVALESNGTYYGFFHVHSRTHASLGGGWAGAVGPVESAEPLVVRIVDRRDTQRVVDRVRQETGTCTVSSSLGCVCNTTFGVCASSAESDTVLRLQWRTANLAYTLYDDTTIVDVSDHFAYDVRVARDATDSATPSCAMSAFASGWPADAPGSNWGVASVHDITTFSLAFTSKELQACGFVTSENDATVLDVHGVFSLYLQSTTSSSSLALHTEVSMRFLDTVHATVLVSAVNERDVNADGDAQVGTTIQVESSLLFYEEGFFELSDNREFGGASGAGSMWIEHSLDSDQDHFFVTLERLYFAASESSSDGIEYEMPASSQAFTNYDLPAHTGRYRTFFDTPLVMNCIPCYMHVVSSLSTTSPTAKSLGGSVAVTDTTAASAVVIRTTASDGHESAAGGRLDPRECAAAATVLVMSRLALR